MRGGTSGVWDWRGTNINLCKNLALERELEQVLDFEGETEAIPILLNE